MNPNEMVLDCLKFAVACAVASFGAFAFLVWVPFADWSTANKVALFQAFVVIAGFGAGLSLLAASVWQSFARSER
jgi:hypothetical protein